MAPRVVSVGVPTVVAMTTHQHVFFDDGALEEGLTVTSCVCGALAMAPVDDDAAGLLALGPDRPVHLAATA